MKICIVGGGTAGFVSALILKSSYPSYTVDIIKSSNIPTIGVGEGSTEHWSRFMDFVGIQAGEMIKECDATFKTGIMFKDWGGRDYLQNVHSHYSADRNGFPIVYSKLMSENVDPRKLTGDYLWDNKTPFMKFIEERPNETGVSQYHFNTSKLNDYLIKNHIVGIHNIDTRKLTKIIRNEGAQKCIISNLSEDIEYLSLIHI